MVRGTKYGEKWEIMCSTWHTDMALRWKVSLYYTHYTYTHTHIHSSTHMCMIHMHTATSFNLWLFILPTMSGYTANGHNIIYIYYTHIMCVQRIGIPGTLAAHCIQVSHICIYIYTWYMHTVCMVLLTHKIVATLYVLCHYRGLYMRPHFMCLFLRSLCSHAVISCTVHFVCMVLIWRHCYFPSYRCV